MAVLEKSREATRFRLVGIDRKSFMAEPAGVGGEIGASSHRALVPRIQEVKYQGRVTRDRRVQAIRRLPSSVAHAGDELAVSACRMERDFHTIAGDRVTLSDESFDEHLHSLDGTIDVAHGGTRATFLAEHVPRFDGVAHFDFDAFLGEFANTRETEF